MKNKNDILKIILIINITIILSIKALSFFKVRNDLPGLLLIFANVSFVLGIISGIKKQLYLRYCFILSFLYFAGFLYYLNSNDSLALVVFEIILIVVYFFIYLLIRNKLHGKYNKSETKLKERISEIYILLTIVSSFFTIYTVYSEIDSHLDRRAKSKRNESDRIENNQRWIDEMTYHIDNLSKNHYISGNQLSQGSNSVFHNFMKVIEVKESEVILVKFRSSGYTPVPRLMEESYIRYDKKDTIKISKRQLRKTISIEIRDDIYKYQDSLKKEGIFYTVKDISYINGPYLSTRTEYGIELRAGDTIFFEFKNLNNKAYLTKIVNVTGDYKWHNKLPMTVNGYILNSGDYNRNSKFSIRATGMDYKKDFKFKLYLKDSLNNRHIYLVKKSSEQNDILAFDCIRVFE